MDNKAITKMLEVLEVKMTDTTGNDMRTRYHKHIEAGEDFHKHRMYHQL